ncbi:ATP-binding protein [Streptococcus oricebi]|uniref:ATP-binding protein n=1 Tax=Streptococcus oricebi TaxID=1547447 RepID=A0ABS5B2E7_9STRE|nr:ATP-binding protein [Streptococcus oricebi]MBP2623012.1 ATP-binding protein [Streptococcus oricebi]
MAKVLTKTHFKSTARTVNLLGRDNVLDFRSAILELVKNSYDAFSGRVDIFVEGSDTLIKNKNDKIATHIEVIDYGKGMDLDTIQEVFFTLGTDKKTNITFQEVENTKRVMNGSMGIGRLSLGRLGNKTQVVTSDGEKAYKFVINWDKFITGNSLDSIEIDIIQLSKEEFSLEYSKRGLNNPENHGTILTSTELKDEWLLSDKLLSGTNYSLLKLSLAKLKNPMKLLDTGDFDIILHYFGEEEEVISSISDIKTDASIEFSYSHENDLLIFDGFFDEVDIDQLPPDFVMAKFNEIKEHIFDGNKKRNRYYFEEEIKVSEFIHDEIPQKPIGDFDGVIYFTKQRKGGSKAPFIKDPLLNINKNEYEPGILLYRDGFRVRPYGEVDTIGFDWLGIESERVKNPAGVTRPSYMMQANQLNGYINITKAKNGIFEDQSNREGLKNSTEFIYLEKIILQIIKKFSSIRSNLHILYNEYLKEVADIKYNSQQGKKLKKKIDTLLQKHQGNQKALFEDNEFTKLINPQTVLELYSLSDTSIEEKDSLISESDMLRTMATQGIVMSTFVHQIKNDRSFFENIPSVLIDIGDYYSNNFKYNFNELPEDYNLYSYSKAIESKNSSILGFIDSSVNNPTRDKKTNINLVAYLTKIFKWWDNSVKDNFNNYEYLINGEKDFSNLSTDLQKIYIKASETQLDSIFLNLITNSFKNFKKPRNIRDCKISVDFEIYERGIRLLYSDNGNGLSSEIEDKNSIFNPYITYSNEGTGMGMWILATVLSNLKGDKKILSEVGERGFQIELILPGGGG